MAAERDRPPDPLDLDGLHRTVEPLLGEAPWEVSVGHGSFVTLQFGAPLPPTPEGFVHGEWHLWVYGCAWRLQDAERVIASCEDSREQMERGAAVLEGRPLRSWRVSAPAMDTVVTFDGGVEVLRGREGFERRQVGPHPFCEQPRHRPGDLAKRRKADGLRQCGHRRHSGGPEAGVGVAARPGHRSGHGRVGERSTESVVPEPGRENPTSPRAEIARLVGEQDP